VVGVRRVWVAWAPDLSQILREYTECAANVQEFKKRGNYVTDHAQRRKMRRSLVIIFLVFTFFLMEFFISNFIGEWVKPHLLLILVVFFTLYSGIRFGLLTAVLAGIIKDSFGLNVFGLNIVSYVVCAYMTVIFRRYVYFKGSQMSRMALIFIVCVIDFGCRLSMNLMLGQMVDGGVLAIIFVGGVLTTGMAATHTFQRLKLCVLKLSV